MTYKEKIEQLTEAVRDFATGVNDCMCEDNDTRTAINYADDAKRNINKLIDVLKEVKDDESLLDNNYDD